MTVCPRCGHVWGERAPNYADRRGGEFWGRVGLPERSEITLVGLAAPHWRWTGLLHARGYGYLRWRGGVTTAPRVAYELLTGAKPAGRLRRVCDLPACVNVLDHYRLVPPYERTVLDSPVFKAELTDAFDEVNLCNRGHTLRPGQRKKDCAKCHRERKDERAHSIIERRILAKAIINSDEDLSTFMR